MGRGVGHEREVRYRRSVESMGDGWVRYMDAR